MGKKIGNIIIPGDANVWPHEHRTAQALTLAGYDVEFVKKNDTLHEATTDVQIDGRLWEIKSFTASSIKAIECNLKRVRWQ